MVITQNPRIYPELRLAMKKDEGYDVSAGLVLASPSATHAETSLRPKHIGCVIGRHLCKALFLIYQSNITVPLRGRFIQSLSQVAVRLDSCTSTTNPHSLGARCADGEKCKSNLILGKVGLDYSKLRPKVSVASELRREAKVLIILQY
jgi:hypothetical protein